MTLNNQYRKWGLLVTIPLVLMIGWLYAQSANRIIPMTEQEAAGIATDAYIYGYALVTTKMTSLAFTNTIKADPATFQAPENQLVNQPKYPPANYHGVAAPNADTLYSAGFLDLAKGPVALSYPNMGKRYFVFPISDAWTTVIHCARLAHHGRVEQNILIAGPSWHGSVPAGMTLVKSPTNMASGSDWGTLHTQRDRSQRLCADEPIRLFQFHDGSNEENSPVLPQDAHIVAKMATIGIVAGQPFYVSQLSPEIQKLLAEPSQFGTSDAGKPFAFSKRSLKVSTTF